jgi:hypothetical protein
MSAIKNFEKAYDSIKREFLYNIVITFSVSKRLVRLMKTFFRWNSE